MARWGEASLGSKLRGFAQIGLCLVQFSSLKSIKAKAE